MIKLTSSLEAWGTPGFEEILKDEVQNLKSVQLPLQQGLSQSSYVSDSGFSVLILTVTDSGSDILVKTGISYSGIIAGSCCADDPTPVCEQTEYCELQLNLNKLNADTTLSLIKD